MIHPIQSFKQMSTGKKVATVIGTAAAAAAIASVPVAFVKGGKADAFTKLANVADGEKAPGALKKLGVRFAEGYKAIGHSIAATAQKINPFKGKGEKTEPPKGE